jgi:hypothetical protein
MTRAVSHDEARAELGATALDALPAEERAAVLEHVAGCAECQAELAAYGATAAFLADAVPATPLAPDRRARVRARLLARAVADAAPAAATPPTLVAAGRPRQESAAARARRRWGASAWLAAAATIAFVAAGAGLLRVARERDALRAALAAADARDAVRADSLRTLAAATTEQRRMLDALTGPNVAVMELTAAGTQEPMARMFWDRASNRWTMIAHHMPKPPAGKTYQLWLVTKDARISAGTFEPGPTGDVMMQADYALEPSALQAIAVTEEPAGGMPQPTGRMVISTIGRGRG